MARVVKTATWVAVLGGRLITAHPCETEIAAACPERPASEMAKCLKNPDEHDTKTTVSSECTDFMALNTACTEDINKHCDENFYNDDTVLCLTQWTEKENLSPKCASVIEWAVPKPDEAEEVTDELGMTQKDIDEKEEWRAKRKASRGDAMERIKMKEADKKKEEDRVALEEFKKNDPEGYAQMVEQQQEDKRQEAAFKKRERQLAAAMERKKKQEQGVSDEEDVQPQAKKSSSGGKKSTAPYPWYVPYAVIIALCAVIYVVFTLTNKGGGKGKNSSGKGKKRR